MGASVPNSTRQLYTIMCFASLILGNRNPEPQEKCKKKVRNSTMIIIQQKKSKRTCLVNKI